MKSLGKALSLWGIIAAVALLCTPVDAQIPANARTIVADVVALDQPFMWNRLGAAQPNGMVFALRHDVISNDGSAQLKAGKVVLKPYKRPRPFVLRANKGDIVEIHFTNLLTPQKDIWKSVQRRPATRKAGVHIMGMELVGSIDSDASFTGRNASSLAAPGESKIYKYFAKEEGTFLLYSTPGDAGGQLMAGLFGAINIQPRGAEWYRSQVTREDLIAATVKDTLGGYPQIDYNAAYTDGPRKGFTVLNMLQKRNGVFELVHSDLTAIITGPNHGRFEGPEVDNDSPSFQDNPTELDRREPYREFTIIYHIADDDLNYFGAVQAFQEFYNPNMLDAMKAGRDAFAINYGTGGIGAEIVANRLGVGPMGNKDAVDLKFEEFFLTSWAVGDPAMVVDVPANVPNQTVGPTGNGTFRQANVDSLDTNSAPSWIYGQNPRGDGSPEFKPLTKKKATKAFYPDDPSNVYHSYMADRVKFRLLHGGEGITHVHHLHAHQWLHSPNSPNGDYLDSQMINPGSSYTLEITYFGSGNLNQTVGDAIFHCHFYPHFAGGMWAHWRVHDVLEKGTKLDKNGIPVAGVNRALPDGEITAGTPIPAVVPLPTRPMAPLPAKVQLTDIPGMPGTQGRRVEVLKDPDGTYENPGYPFFIPGVAGHRPPHPPLDFAWNESKSTPQDTVYLDGGLPRHLILDGIVVREYHTRWDFTKDFILYDSEDKTDRNRKAIAGGLTAFELPEKGTAVEQAAMDFHAQRYHGPGITPSWKKTPHGFFVNGLPPTHGAPYAEPAIDTSGAAVKNPARRYKAAVIQTDVVFNKKGWHYPQQRFITLWGDVNGSVTGTRPPEPFFFRVNSGDPIEFWHTNLVPDYYELDDFQVRTPTDILGQHIHLVKFDVTSSDGAANGFNYEDGTLSPDEVRIRIDAANRSGGLYAFDDATQFRDTKKQKKLTVVPVDSSYGGIFGTPPPYQNWDGAQTTIQRWYADPILNKKSDPFDRTLRTVFTHDHYSPSTHQQIGLYAGLVVEPTGSKWLDPVSGVPLNMRTSTNGTMYPRNDGGPTSWQANIIAAEPDDSYREFLLEFQDFQLAYTRSSRDSMAHVSIPAPDSSALFAIIHGVGPIVNDLNNNNAMSLLPHMRQNGITVSDTATVEKVSANQWRIKDPAFIVGAANRQAHAAEYAIRKVRVDTGKTIDALMVYTPELQGWADRMYAINSPPNFRLLPSYLGPAQQSRGPFPSLISIGPNPGTYSMNYRNEPLPLRVNRSPKNKANLTGIEAQRAADLSYAFSSIKRFDPDLNTQPTLGAPINPTDPSTIKGWFQFPDSALTPGMQPTDPFTPMMRAYQNDKVQIRTLVGAHMRPHFFNIHGIRWFFEPTYPNSGYRNTQGMSLSEHFEMLFTLPPAATRAPYPFADYLYIANSANEGLTNGIWGILRAYKGKTDSLTALPNNPSAGANVSPPQYPKPNRVYNIVATSAQQALGGALVYNDRGTPTNNGFNSQFPIIDPDALIYVIAESLQTPAGKLKPGVSHEPLILRAAAGDMIQINLKNEFQPSNPKFNSAFKDSVSTGPPFGSPDIQTSSLLTSQEVGLHPQLVSYDITQSNGINIGFNPIQTIKHGDSTTVYWYAGIDSILANGCVKRIPVEFGSINLLPSDPLTQHRRGLVGALIIEPAGSTWKSDPLARDPKSRASAIVTKKDGSTFREFVMITQDDLILPTSGRYKYGTGTQFGLNYRIEPWYNRFPSSDNWGNARTGQIDISDAVSNSLLRKTESNISEKDADPKTPLFKAYAGETVRFRIVHPGGTGNGQMLTLHGHVWQEEPYTKDATVIGDNPLSQWFGSRQYGANDSFEILLESAGGTDQVAGDYLYRSFPSGDPVSQFGEGLWGVFRVLPKPSN